MVDVVLNGVVNMTNEQVISLGKAIMSLLEIDMQMTTHTLDQANSHTYTHTYMYIYTVACTMLCLLMF